jgi:hypothetical protein
VGCRYTGRRSHGRHACTHRQERRVLRAPPSTLCRGRVPPCLRPPGARPGGQQRCRATRVSSVRGAHSTRRIRRIADAYRGEITMSLSASWMRRCLAARAADVRERLAGEPQGHLRPAAPRKPGQEAPAGAPPPGGRKPRRSSPVNSGTTPDLSVKGFFGISSDLSHIGCAGLRTQVPLEAV